MVSSEQRQRIRAILDGFSTSPELEIQQRAVEFESLFDQREIVSGVLEQMPPPEIKATVIGTGNARYFKLHTARLTGMALVSENRTVGSTKGEQNVSSPYCPPLG